MTDGWFDDDALEDDETGATAIREGSADGPRAWPSLAVEAGFAADEEEYYDRLHEATLAAASEAASERERADDRQLVHAIRAMDDCQRTANELAERVTEWAGSRGIVPERRGGAAHPAKGGPDLARAIAERGREEAGESRTDGDGLVDGVASASPRLVSLAERTAALVDEAADLRASIERTAPEIAPNLATIAGPVLAARLIALAGSLEDLAKLPSGTVQVLGAEDALFAHLRGNAPSPKHGIIYTHEAVRGTHPDHRGSAARALAGKLSIAARVDHYSGDRRPSIEADLADRIERIQSRSSGGEDS